ncbi:MAG: ATP-binding cassette domain-containing protein, partial [Anaeroplasmataceae bacterium]|nr:ATP-binding cassette domain-containing protein [Anaeroplasmataceae bacterium]
MIKIEHLNKYYHKGKDNEIHVINDASLELPSTGLISFLGVSGSGKTTLLNVIGGLDKAKGSISYDDLKIENYKMHQVDCFRSKEIGYVFQNYNLLLEETVYSNL